MPPLPASNRPAFSPICGPSLTIRQALPRRGDTGQLLESVSSRVNQTTRK